MRATISSMWELKGRKVYKTARGYVMVALSEHPGARRGTIFLHRVVAENELGRRLAPGEVVHHRNGDKADNRWVNLEVTTKSEHARAHAQQRPVVGETMVSLVCPQCAKLFQRPKRNVKTPLSFCSRSCSATYYGHRGAREIPHGAYGRYRKGCRCEACKEANRLKAIRYRSSFASVAQPGPERRA